MENKVTKILAIDDNQDNLTILKALITEAFPETVVLSALNGRKALEIADKEEPDVILLDIFMPGMDGFEVCRKLKADKLLRDIPVVFITASKSDKESRIRALEAGAEAFLFKPIDESELIAQIRAMLKIRASNIQKRNENIRLRKTSQENVYRFQSMFDHMSSSAAIYKVLNNGSTGKDYIIMDFNKAALQIEGMDKDDVLGKSLHDLRPNIDDYGLIPAFQKAWLTGKPVFFPSKVYIDDKYNNWYENRIFKLPSGEIAAIYDDVTDKMLIQEKLEASEQKYRQIAENISDVVWTADMDMRTTYISPSVEKTLGESPAAHMAKTLAERVTPDSLKKMNTVILEELAKEKEPKSDKNRTRIIELEHYLADGSVIWISMHISFIRDENGNAVGIQGVSRDITERRRIEEQLKQSLKDLLESQRIAHLGTWRLNLATNQVVWSEEIYKIYGFDPTLPPPPYTEHMKLFTPESWDRLSTFLEDTRTSGTPYELELETVKIDGSKGWMWVRGEAETDSEGNTITISGTAQDITQRQKIEEASIGSELRYRRLFEAAKDGILILDAETGMIMDVNPFLIKLLNYTKEQFIEKAIWDIGLFKDMVSNRNSFLELQQKKYVRYEDLPLQTADGSLISVEFISNEYLVGEKKVIQCNIRDITERKLYAEKISKTLEGTIETLALVVEARDPYTSGHQKRVAKIAVSIAENMGLSKSQVHGLYLASIVHDIGKIQIPAEILNKPGKLTNLEFELIKCHPEAAYSLLKDIEFPWPLAEIAYQHHERIDGSGYPRKLTGDSILIEAKILCVADVVEAMSSHRPYRPAFTIETALAEIEKYKGAYYDKDVVEACLNVYENRNNN